MMFYDSLILIIIAIVLFLYSSLKNRYIFFVKQDIPHLKSSNLIFGHMKNVILLKKSIIEAHKDIYEALEPHKFGGFYAMHVPTLLIRDPDLIKTILVKNFNHFHDRGFTVHKELEPIFHSLLNMKGEEWKNLRAKLVGAFTSRKIKMIFPLIKDCGDRLHQIVEQMNANESLEIQDLVSRYTTNVIGVCAFGLETNSLDDPNSEFRQMGKKIFDFRFATVVRGLWPSIPMKLIKIFNLLLNDKILDTYFTNLVDVTMKYREANNIRRNDFMDLMIDLKHSKYFEKILNNNSQNYDKTIKIIAAQSMQFFAAGFHVTATALSFLFLELAQNEKIQNKIREEIETNFKKSDDNLTYEFLTDMSYTDMVIDETLRKYPTGGFLIRECTQNFKIPDTNIIIPEKTPIVISAYGLHYDPQYYEKPDEFHPEHFTEEAKAKRPPFTYLPFGGGPRGCIAQHFSKVVIKIGLISMLRGFKYQVSTRTKFPIELEKNIGFMQIKNEIWLEFHKI